MKISEAFMNMVIRQWHTGEISFSRMAELINEAAQPRWIPVTERLPEVGKLIAAYYKDRRTDCFIYDGIIDYFEIMYSHWMELPPKPETPETHG